MITYFIIIASIVVAGIVGYKLADTNKDGKLSSQELEDAKEQVENISQLATSLMDDLFLHQEIIEKIANKLFKVSELPKLNKVIGDIGYEAVREKNLETNRTETVIRSSDLETLEDIEF